MPSRIGAGRAPAGVAADGAVGSGAVARIGVAPAPLSRMVQRLEGQVC